MLTLALLTMAADSDKKPSMAFLEYLASLEKVDGKLVGPMDLLDQEIAIKGKVEENKKAKPVKEINVVSSKENRSQAKTIEKDKGEDNE